jgi:hypothetical protein
MKTKGTNERQDDSLSAVAVPPETLTRRSTRRRESTPPSSMRRRAGIGLGLGLVTAVLCALLAPGQEYLTAPGKMNTGHGDLDCTSCHRPAPGTVRQQIQAGTRFLLGLRETPVDFGFRKVQNRDCNACHERPFDRHPVFRFNEPRFSDVRKVLAPQQCASCHREHSGRRVTVEPGYCRHCHGELQMKNDPLDVPHATLVRESLWLSCLGCHDFHGNHEMQSPARFGDAISALRVGRYFQGDASPYPTRLKQPARQKRDDLDR